jgi:hypothetical protein
MRLQASRGAAFSTGPLEREQRQGYGQRTLGGNSAEIPKRPVSAQIAHFKKASCPAGESMNMTGHDVVPSTTVSSYA